MTIVQPTADTPRWAMLGQLSVYPWDQCWYCRIGASRDCNPVACLLCGTVQCMGHDSRCAVCLVGWKPGWSRGYLGGEKCGYAQCDEPAVAVIRKKRMCTGHATKAKISGQPVPGYLAQRLAHRDEGTGWENWRLRLRCGVELVSHQDGRPDSQCILGADHIDSDSDHIDGHGCHGPVLVHQASIEEAAHLTELDNQ